MKIFVFLADGFEEIEAIAAVDIFRRAEIEVQTVSITTEKTVIGAHNIPVLSESVFSEIDFPQECLLYLPGGMPGTKNLAAHKGLIKLIQKQADAQKHIAAICAAPSILGQLGLLHNKEAICYPGFENQLSGAILSEHKIAISNNILTAKGAGVAIEFALKIVETIKGKDTAISIEKAIQL